MPSDSGVASAGEDEAMEEDVAGMDGTAPRTARTKKVASAQQEVLLLHVSVELIYGFVVSVQFAADLDGLVAAAAVRGRQPRPRTSRSRRLRANPRGDAEQSLVGMVAAALSPANMHDELRAHAGGGGGVCGGGGRGDHGRV
jgi:hypothetical protein